MVARSRSASRQTGCHTPVHASWPASAHPAPLNPMLIHPRRFFDRLRLGPRGHTRQPPLLARPDALRPARRPRRGPRPPPLGRARARGRHRFGERLAQPGLGPPEGVVALAQRPRRAPPGCALTRRGAAPSPHRPPLAQAQMEPRHQRRGARPAAGGHDLLPRGWRAVAGVTPLGPSAPGTTSGARSCRMAGAIARGRSPPWTLRSHGIAGSRALQPQGGARASRALASASLLVPARTALRTAARAARGPGWLGTACRTQAAKAWRCGPPRQDAPEALRRGGRARPERAGRLSTSARAGATRQRAPGRPTGRPMGAPVAASAPAVGGGVDGRRGAAGAWGVACRPTRHGGGGRGGREPPQGVGKTTGSVP
jgi:hypothetical protein